MILGTEELEFDICVCEATYVLSVDKKSCAKNCELGEWKNTGRNSYNTATWCSNLIGTGDLVQDSTGTEPVQVAAEDCPATPTFVLDSSTSLTHNWC